MVQLFFALDNYFMTTSADKPLLLIKRPRAAKKPRKQTATQDYGFKNPIAFTMPESGELFKCNYCTFSFADKRSVTLVLELL